METHLPSKFLHAHKNLWLCAMGRQNLTNQRTDFFPQHLKCYDNFEMHEQKSIKVLLYKCLPELLHDCILKKQASITKSNLFCLVCSLWGASHLLYMKMIIFSGFSYFLSDL